MNQLEKDFFPVSIFFSSVSTKQLTSVFNILYTLLNITFTLPEDTKRTLLSYTYHLYNYLKS